MSEQTNLFNIQEKTVYCIDTCVFLNCLNISTEVDEPYAADVFPGALAHIEAKMVSGKVVSTVATYNELRKRESKVEGLKDWLRGHKQYFIEEDLAQAQEMKPITIKYPVYATDKGDYGDVALVGFARSRGLTVVTAETRKDQHRQLHPKVPNVCDEFDVPCLSVVGFLRAEGLVFTLSTSSVSLPEPAKEKVPAFPVEQTVE